MEISGTDRKKNEYMLHTVKEEKNIIHKKKTKKEES
jgi:hypothetical protein